MISELRISDLGVIAGAALELDAGFTVVTGETGAGKTMVVSSLAMLLGERADASRVRAGADRARVEGVFADLPSDVLAAVDELGGRSDDGEVILARQIGASRSRAFVGGAAVPTSACAELGGRLVVIHGQSEQARLRTADRQRAILDTHAGAACAETLARYREAWAERRATRAELDDLRGRARERARELDVLRFGLDEIAAVAPQTGEDADLATETARLQHADDLRLAAAEARTALAGTDENLDAPNVLGLAATARTALERGAHADPTARDLARRAAELSTLAADLAADTASWLADLESDPARLEALTERRAALSGLVRKYGETSDDVAGVLAWAEAARTRVAELDGGDERVAALAEREAALSAELTCLAATLTEKRTAAAHDLEARVHDELAALAMPHARLSFAIEPLDDLGPWGGDAVTLLLAANPGAHPQPLAKAASGGELSRVRLALEVVLADEAPATLVFDEVDAGVGGAVGVEIGRRLARLAERAQVIVVTHLAQVAAFADRHWVVEKSSDGQVTTSDLREISGTDRAAELARMMAGLDTSSSSLAHAEELLATAARPERASDSGSGRSSR